MEDKHISYTIISDQFAAMQINSDNDSWQVDFGDGSTSETGLTMRQIQRLNHKYTDGLTTHNIKYYNSNKNAKIERILTWNCQEEISAFTKCDYNCSELYDISDAFMDCEQLEDISGLKNMKNITNLDFTFFGCQKLSDISPIQKVLTLGSSKYSFWGTQIMKINIVTKQDVNYIKSYGVDIANHKAFKNHSFFKKNLSKDTKIDHEDKDKQPNISHVHFNYNATGELGIKGKINGIKTDLYIIAKKDYKEYKKKRDIKELAKKYLVLKPNSESEEEVKQVKTEVTKVKPKPPRISNIHIFQTKKGLAINCEINGKKTESKLLSREDNINFNELTNRKKLATKYFVNPQKITKTNVLQKITKILTGKTFVSNNTVNKNVSYNFKQ